MKACFILASYMLLPVVSSSQQHYNDYGTADTISLELATPLTHGTNLSLIVEAWVYSDEPILAFSAGFHWDNSNLHLDSAKPSLFLKDPAFSLFFYQDDNFNLSNQYQTFVLGGVSLDTTGNGLEGNSQSRRLWATYYFTLSNWDFNDSLYIDTLPHTLMDFKFVKPGPFSTLGFEPQFGPPIRLGGFSTAIEELSSNLPSDFELGQNYPNPFNPETAIQFRLPQSTYATLEVFNPLGQKVKTLVQQQLSAGTYDISWDGRLPDGTTAPSGVYLYRLVAGDLKETKKMVLLK